MRQGLVEENPITHKYRLGLVTLGGLVLAVPVRHHTGRVVAALGVSGPSFRLCPEKFPALAERLRSRLARDLSNWDTATHRKRLEEGRWCNRS